MDNQKKYSQAEEWLRIIERTRLFCNTAEELGRMVGFSVTNRNSLLRKGGNSTFMKEAIFHQLGYMCKERTGLDLQSLIEAYLDVDNFIDRYAIRLRDKELLPQIVDMFFGSGMVPTGLDFAMKRLTEQHIPILVLMHIGSLPRLSAKSGDVQNIEEDYARTFSTLREYCKNVFIEELPIFAIMEAAAKQHSELRNRLHLINTATKILNSYGSLSTQERLSLSNRELQERLIDPEVDGIWTEDDSYTAFWYFKEVVNGYYFYHYTLRNEQQELAYTKYFMAFYVNDEEDIDAMIMHPRSTQYILNSQPIPNIFLDYQTCDFDTDEIIFTPKGESKAWFDVSRLRRSSHAKYFQSLLDDKSKVRINENSDSEYDFCCCISAITPDYIYMPYAKGGYYKIPKSLNDVLDDVQFGDNVGLITFEGSTFVAFDDKSLYYDVTTKEKMREYGIEVVKLIT